MRHGLLQLEQESATVGLAVAVVLFGLLTAFYMPKDLEPTVEEMEAFTFLQLIELQHQEQQILVVAVEETLALLAPY